MLKKPDPTALAASPDLVAKMITGNCLQHYRDGRVEVVA